MNPPSRNFVGKKIDDFILIDVLGTGAFGQVFAAQNLVTKETVAIKSVAKTKLREHNGMVGQLLKAEVSILMGCNNFNVVKMMKYLESENNCYLVMEFCNQGDLEQLWKKKDRRFPEIEAVQYLKQILNGMRGLHEMNVIHRDLKLPNILILNNTLKIGDLGFAKRLDDKEALVKDALGTLGTMAPEVIEFKPYGMLADMFSLGAIYYQMLFGVLPFSIKSYDDFLKDVKSSVPNFNRNGVTISNESQDLLTKMLQPDPKNRLPWNQIYEHPLFIDQRNPNTGTLNQKLTMQQVVAKQVDLKQNKAIYDTKKTQFDELTGDNMIEKIKKEHPKEIAQQAVKESQSQDQYLYQQAKQQHEMIKIKDEELNKTLELYLGERNVLVFLATLLQEIHQFQHSQNTNVFLPAFIIAKKLLLEIDNLIYSIKRQANIFNCRCFVDLNVHPQFLEFQKTLEEDYSVILSYFNVIQSQLKVIFERMPKPNELYVQELNPRPSPQFKETFRDVLFNYYLQLQDEKDIQQQDVKRNTVNNLMICVLDTLLFDKQTREILKFKQVDTYFSELNFLVEKEKEALIGEKFNQAMC